MRPKRSCAARARLTTEPLGLLQHRESNDRAVSLSTQLLALAALPRHRRRRVEKRRFTRAFRLQRAWWRARQDDAEIALNFLLRGRTRVRLTELLSRASAVAPEASHHLLAFVTRRTREAHLRRERSA